jgi:hypothetical protein
MNKGEQKTCFSEYLASAPGLERVSIHTQTSHALSLLGVGAPAAGPTLTSRR